MCAPTSACCEDPPQVAAMDAGRSPSSTVALVGSGSPSGCTTIPTPRPGRRLADGDAQVSAERVATTATHARRCAGLAVEMEIAQRAEGELSGDASSDSFCSPPSARSDRRSVLGLCAADPATRLDVIDGLLDDVEAGCDPARLSCKARPLRVLHIWPCPTRTGQTPNGRRLDRPGHRRRQGVRPARNTRPDQGCGGGLVRARQEPCSWGPCVFLVLGVLRMVLNEFGKSFAAAG